MRHRFKRPLRQTPRQRVPVIPNLTRFGSRLLSRGNPYYLIPVAGIFASLFIHQQMVITVVTCRIDRQEACPPEAQAMAQQYQGRSALTLDPRMLAATVHQALPHYASIDAAISLPSTLTLHFTSSQPLVQIVTASDSAALAVNTNFVITGLEPQPDPDTFSIVSRQPLKPEVGAVLTDQTLLAAVKVYALLRERFIPVTTLTVVSPQRIEAESKETTMLFSSFKSLEDQVASLQIILGTDTMETNPQVIDLRPERPVLY